MTSRLPWPSLDFPDFLPGACVKETGGSAFSVRVFTDILPPAELGRMGPRVCRLRLSRLGCHSCLRVSPGPTHSCPTPPACRMSRMRGRPLHCRAAQPTPQPFPPSPCSGLSHLVCQVGCQSRLCDGHWPCGQAGPVCRGRLLGTPARLCSLLVSNCALATLCADPSADRRQGSPAQPLVWKSLCWGRVQYLSNLLLRGPLMGSIRKAWHSEALLCPGGPLGSCESGPPAFRPSRQSDKA